MNPFSPVHAPYSCSQRHSAPEALQAKVNTELVACYIFQLVQPLRPNVRALTVRYSRVHGLMLPMFGSGSVRGGLPNLEPHLKYPVTRTQDLTCVQVRFRFKPGSNLNLTEFLHTEAHFFK